MRTFCFLYFSLESFYSYMIVFTVSAMIKLLLIPFNKFLISDFFFISRNSIWFFKYLSSLPIFMFSFNFFNRFMADWIFQSAHNIITYCTCSPTTLLLSNQEMTSLCLPLKLVGSWQISCLRVWMYDTVISEVGS